ncbi:uncharacterized protein LOC113563035 [Ooceraea biroi]|uniref:uncharacterized protein LOC113563035 n=1 Tax=Ooceraea biroi TaxID=2015173 RepID=UPI000F098D07|nr:uncharacterized protein LOC113563035 [Ooceraea biroi]
MFKLPKRVSCISRLPKRHTCRSCQQKHHSMLHTSAEPSSGSSTIATTDTASISTTPAAEVTSLISSSDKRLRSRVLLATALNRVSISSGRFAVVRALIDQGSEMTFVSERLVQLLKAKRVRSPISVSALGGISAGTFRHAVQIRVTPSHASNPTYDTTAVILPKTLTSYAPTDRCNFESYAHLKNLTLADVDPTSSEPIEVLLGADLYSDILRDGFRRGETGQPIAQNSVFGWIISGPVEPSDPGSTAESTISAGHLHVHHVSSSESLDRELRRFWETEEVLSRPIADTLDDQCEQHFQSTHSRDSEGRYIVRLPFRRGPPINIGHSRTRAESCLHSVFAKLRRNDDLKKEYTEFMDDYERLGHMRPAPRLRYPTDQVVYIPHHAVVRESNTTTRLRVVFNASSATSNGTSLNDHLLPGPKLQTDLPAVIMQWRQHKYVYSADIVKMYHQIRIHEDDVDYQRIVWLDTQSRPLDYQLLTVTYGMACSPFLALGVIRQLSRDEGHRFPLAVQVLRDKIYVDDVLFGADDLTRIRLVRDQIIALLQSGGFTLRKWSSNSVELLADIDRANHGLACSKDLSSDDRVKILGIGWNPSADAFEFRVSLPDIEPRTKRLILSSIAKLFDPLGWVTPVITTAKIFMQQLWKTKLGWDESIPDPLLSKWHAIYAIIDSLNGLTVTRWTGLSANIRYAELHGFSDASTLAYAAAVYIKTVQYDGEVRVTLLVGKSKVAPLKPMTIPRLKLSAAGLLAKLIPFARRNLGIDDLPCHCWTDSTVVLAWISQHPSRWRTFVANRVAEVQEQLASCEWHHVPTDCNPADCASRGVLANEIGTHPLWWHGPSWLKLSADNWPSRPAIPTADASLEEK